MPLPVARPSLIEESNDLSRDVFPSSLFVIHDAGTRGQDNVSKLTGRQKFDDPLLQITQLDIVSRWNNTSLIETAIELNDNLAWSVVVDFFVFPDVTCVSCQYALCGNCRVERCRGQINVYQTLKDRKALCKNDRSMFLFRALKGQRSWGLRIETSA